MATGDKNLRVAIYIGQLARGGAEGQVALLAAGLADRGHDVRVLTGERSSKLPDTGIGELVVLLPDRPRFSRFRSLRRFLRNFRPDVLHNHLSVANVFGTLAAAAERVPCRVMSLLSTDPFKAKLISAAERFAAKFAHRVMVNSEAVRKTAIRNGFPHGKITLIYNGVDANRFSPDRKGEYRQVINEKLDIPSGAFVIGSVANFHPVKDHRTLLAAFARVREKVRQAELYLVLVGSGPEERAIKDEAAALGILPYVRFAGSVPDVERYYAAMNVFTLTSLAEGFSNAVLEAMASGLPCVVTDAGGNAEAVEEGASGYVVGRGDAGAVSDKILSLVGDGRRRAEMGEAARRIAVGKFSIDRMVDEAEAMYWRVLE